jgi:hypothetical protein
MNSQLEVVVLKLCENLPRDLTLFEQKGQCKKHNEHCQYCKKNESFYLCYKKTYDMDKSLISI